jgi:hypothetical protein
MAEVWEELRRTYLCTAGTMENTWRAVEARASKLLTPKPVATPDPDAEAEAPQTCRNCRAFRTQPDYPDNGWCHMHPPVRIRGEQDGWPNTNAELWCCDWRAVAKEAKSG